MRKYVEVMGVGKRKFGVGKKSGAKYDLVELSIAYDADGFNGRKCETVAVDTELLGDRNLMPGEVLDLVMHQANFKTYVDAVL